MAFSLVQSKTGSVGAANATSVTVTVASTGSGNLLVAFVDVSGTAGVTITPPSGWSQVGTTQAYAVGNGSVAMFYLANSASGVTSVVFSFSVSCNAAVAFEEWSGVATTSPLDQFVAQQNAKTTAAPTGTTAALAAAGELAIWGLAVGAASTTTYSGVTNSYVEDTSANAHSTEASQAQATLFYNTSVGSAATSSAATMNQAGGTGNTTILAVFKAASTATTVTKTLQSRFLLRVQHTQTLVARFLLRVQNTQTLVSRFLLSVQNTKVLQSRFLLRVQQTKTLQSRVGLRVQNTKTLQTRFLLLVGTLATKTLQSRFLLRVQSTKTLVTRFLLRVQAVKTLQTRFLLMVQHTKTLQSRFLLRVQSTQTLVSRFLLRVLSTKTVQARILLAIQITKTLQARIKLRVQSTRTLVTRFVLALPVLPAGKVNVSISGTPLLIYEGTFEIDDSVKQASTFMAKIRDDAGTSHFTKGQPVSIVDSAHGLLYTGFVTTAVEDRESPQTLIKTDLGARDNHYLVEKRTYDGPEFTNVPAGAIVCQILNVLSQEGITAKYAADRDTTATDFNAGTLTSVAGASNVADGDLELSPAGTAVTISEATTADFASGTLSSVTAANNSLMPTATNAIKLVATCSQPGSTNAYTYVKVWQGSKAIGASERFSYDVFILPSSPTGQMAVDVIFTDDTTFRDTAQTPDVQYIFSHPKNDVGPMGVGAWYHRSFFWGNYSGKTVQSVQVVCEGDTVGVYTGYFKNIFLTNANFTFTLNTTQEIGTNGYSSSVVSVVPTYDLTSAFRTSISRSVSAAQILKSSNVTWTASQPAGTLFQLLYSLDGGNIFISCTKNAPLPALPAGSKIAGDSIIFSEQFIYDPAVTGSSRPGPEVAPVLTALQVAIQPSYAATKTDVVYEVAANADWALGTFTRTTNNGGSDLSLKQFIRNWDNGDVSSQTLFGTGAATSSADRQYFHIAIGSAAAAISRLDFAGNIADGTVETDILVDNVGARIGIAYRTTFWSNTDLTCAYFVEVTLNSLKLFRGTNSAGAVATQIGATVTLGVTTGNWHRLKVTFVGSSHNIYFDDVLLLSATDATFTAAGNVGLRISNGTGAAYTAFFDNFGVISSGTNLNGTWVSPSQSIAGAGTYGTSVVSWRDVSSDVGNTDTVLVETSVNGGTSYQTAINGGPIPNLVAGQSLAGISFKVRITLTTTTASTSPAMDYLMVRVVSQLSASGNRISPALSLANVGPLGGSVVAWNLVPLPTGCTFGIDVRVDAGAWVDVTASPNGAIPSLIAQGAVVLDMFAVDSSANYTNTFMAGGAAGTATFDTANKRLILSGGTNQVEEYTGLSFADGYVECDMDWANIAGPVLRMVDASHCYFLKISDDQGTNPQTIQLFKNNGGAAQIGSTASINFVRGTYHRIHFEIAGSSITVNFDGLNVLTATDSSIAGPGLAGLFQNTKGQFYSIRIQPAGQDVSSHTVQTRLRLASTNPLSTPQVSDLSVAAFGTTIGVGSVIPQTSMFHKYCDVCIDDNANASDYWWNIDKNKVTYFLPQNAIPSPWVASDGGSVPTSGDFLDANITIEDASDLYRNREIVDNVLAPITINQNFVGNGVATSWTCGNQWAGAPVVTITNTVTGVVSLASVGVLNVDTGKQFYYAVGNPTITEDASGPLYDFTFTLNFTGPGQFLTFSQYDDLAGQAARALVEGGGSSGIVTWTVDGTGLTKAQGDALAAADVGVYGQIGRLLKATTRRYGLAPGQALPLFLPSHNVWNELFFIRSVKTHLTTEFPNGTAGGSVQQGWYDVECISGPNVGDWTKLYKRPRNKPPL